MADKKEYKPVVIKEKKPVIISPAASGAAPAKKKRGKSAFIIWGVVLAVVIFYVVSSMLGKYAKYDVYALNSELNFDKIATEHAPLLRRVAEINSSLPELMMGDRELALNTILSYADEILAYNAPAADKLVSVQAAEFDMLNFHYKYVAGIADAETLDSAKRDLSVAIARVDG
ncbi:hypothetical protein FACS189490_11150 [Clostridia bacterium]|nr:hypothetical protein FACS189490_11150 [Clostridia bacterium]